MVLTFWCKEKCHTKIPVTFPNITSAIYMVAFYKKETQEGIKETGKIEGDSFAFWISVIKKKCCVITVIKITSYIFLVINENILSQDFTILLKTKD